MHEYWQAVMTSFEQELLGSCGFSLIPPDGLGMVISANPRLLLPSKSMLAYARKQSQLPILEWDEECGGWYWHAGDYPPGWEKKVKIINLLASGKKETVKPKSAKKGGEVVPFESDLPSIGRMVLKGFPPSSACTRSSARPAVSKPKSTTPRPSTGAPPSSKTRGSKRKTSPPPVPITERKVCYL